MRRGSVSPGKDTAMPEWFTNLLPFVAVLGVPFVIAYACYREVSAYILYRWDFDVEDGRWKKYRVGDFPRRRLARKAAKKYAGLTYIERV